MEGRRPPNRSAFNWRAKDAAGGVLCHDGCMLGTLLKLMFFGCLAFVGLTVAIVVVLILMNSRDPYGGPIEPAGEH